MVGTAAQPSDKYAPLEGSMFKFQPDHTVDISYYFEKSIRPVYFNFNRFFA